MSTPLDDAGERGESEPTQELSKSSSCYCMSTMTPERQLPNVCAMSTLPNTICHPTQGATHVNDDTRTSIVPEAPVTTRSFPTQRKAFLRATCSLRQATIIQPLGFCSGVQPSLPWQSITHRQTHDRRLQSPNAHCHEGQQMAAAHCHVPRPCHRLSSQLHH